MTTCRELILGHFTQTSALQVHLLEVNQAPSFTADSPLDLRIKTNVVSGAFELCGLCEKRKKLYENEKKKWQSNLFSASK